jgi:N-acyl-D-amino-acid deacylase
MSLEEAIWKMTGMPAKRLGFSDRGRITEGFIADLAIFDPDEIIDHSTFDAPHQISDGVIHVLVNGELVVPDKVHTGVRSGRVIRRST